MILFIRIHYVYVIIWPFFFLALFLIMPELSLAFPSRYVPVLTHRDKQFLFIFTDRSAIGQRLFNLRQLD